MGFVAADAARDEVVRQEVRLEKNVSRMRALQAKARALVSANQVPAAAHALEQLAEDLRFSDPVSSESLAEIEGRLADCLDRLQEAVSGPEYGANRRSVPKGRRNALGAQSALQAEQAQLTADKHRRVMVWLHAQFTPLGDRWWLVLPVPMSGSG